MVVASGDGMAQLLDARKGGSCVATYNCKTPVNCIETSNETILAGSVDGRLLVLHADINEENGGGDTISGASSLQDHAVALNSISVLRCAPSLLRVATAADDGSIHVYAS
ncbi:hypothetical protein KP509_1Z172900 [Ceratopteris richardii]|nr:hypothetical protein KP509_1Z172900 [Ceratopteris richardii]